MTATTCPSEQQLRDFQLGDLPEPVLGQVADHLEACPRCETLAQRLDTQFDPVLAAIRLPPGATPPKDSQSLPVAIPMATPVEAPAPVDSYPFLLPPTAPGELGRLGIYRVFRLLGKGGMAYVFHAEDSSLDRPVALKVMKPDVYDDPDGGQRFLREARTLAGIKHPHLVTVYQAGHENGVVWLAMELLEGESLGDRLDRRGACDIPEAIRLSREITGGLIVVHGHGLIHRDIKPDNIWLEAPHGNVKILDFGLARLANEDVRLTRTGTIMGTPSFMSPEQARGLDLDARSDLFSLGAVFYCLCTGKEPFQAANTMAVLTALAVDTPTPPHLVNPAIPRALSDLIVQMLAKKPGDRPVSAEQVLERLKQIEVESGAKVMAAGLPLERVALRMASLRRNKVLVGAGLLLALTTGACLGLLSLPPRAKPSTGVRAQATQPDTGTTEAAATVYLSRFTPVESANWPLPPFKDGKKQPNLNALGAAGKPARHGILLHPGFDGPASVTYALDGTYRKFRGEVTINDSSKGSMSPMTFRVWGNGKQLWKSEPVSTSDDSHLCEVDMKGIRTLKLEVSVSGKAGGAHGLWIDPELIP
ncbi:MAG: protein kinase [Gemmataceae bacterium]|nr:protein kinase [Gemmataceae bacterium]